MKKLYMYEWSVCTILSNGERAIEDEGTDYIWSKNYRDAKRELLELYEGDNVIIEMIAEVKYIRKRGRNV